MTPAHLSATQLAELLRRTRLAAGLSLREAAGIARTSHATWLAYETGRKIPSVVVFVRLLEACSVGVDIVTEPRIRRRDGIERGAELASALRLAEQFPAKVARRLRYPRLSRRG
jgi:transcriptional regulator with XRE-family HTH domain